MERKPLIDQVGRGGKELKVLRDLPRALHDLVVARRLGAEQNIHK
jgi:hypothetical protein